MIMNNEITSPGDPRLGTHRTVHPIEVRLQAIEKRLEQLGESQALTYRSLRALPGDFLQALESKYAKPPPTKRDAKRIVLNLALIIFFCAAVFFLFWAIRP
jgi:hypothetical protein